MILFHASANWKNVFNRATKRPNDQSSTKRQAKMTNHRAVTWLNSHMVTWLQGKAHAQ
jgi:hypothetical protein